nr:hypothetical protein [Tanacetum cinerariifolium]
EREAMHAPQAWSHAMDCNRARINDDDRLTSHILHEHDRFRELERTRDVERQDGPADTGDNRDGGGSGGVGAEPYSAMRASMAAGRGGWGWTVFCALRRPV